MSRHPLSWLRKVLSGDRSNPDEATEPAVERPSVSLFECEDCETTYIGVDKRSCSQCGASVREIPSERDLRRSRSEDANESLRPCDR